MEIQVKLSHDEIKAACVAYCNEKYEMHNREFNHATLGPIADASGRLNEHEDVAAVVTVRQGPCRHTRTIVSHGGSSVDTECLDCGKVW